MWTASSTILMRQAFDSVRYANFPTAFVTSAGWSVNYYVKSVSGVSRSTNHITMEIANSHRYSIREGILIYNQNDLKMIWIRLFALLLVGSTMLPLISFSLTELLKIARQDEPNYSYSLFQTTSMTFLFYTVLLCSVKFI